MRRRDQPQRLGRAHSTQAGPCLAVLAEIALERLRLGLRPLEERIGRGATSFTTTAMAP